MTRSAYDFNAMASIKCIRLQRNILFQNAARVGEGEVHVQYVLATFGAYMKPRDYEQKIVHRANIMIPDILKKWIVLFV